MKRLSLLALVAAGVLTLVGCGMAGDWRTIKVMPENASGNFQFSSIELSDDGTYAAVASYGGETVHSSGTWEHKEDQLIFHTAGGETLVYDAWLSNMGNNLHVKRSFNGTEIESIMKREG